MTQQQKLLGLNSEKKVSVDVRVWEGQKLALWRSKVGWEIVAKQAAEIVANCRHTPIEPTNHPAQTAAPLARESFWLRLAHWFGLARKMQLTRWQPPTQPPTPCPGATNEREPCLPSCQDREIRMSALVVLNAAQQFAPPIASKLAEQPYLLPSREYFAEIIGELGACQAELTTVRGSVVTMPTPNPPQLPEKQT
ncbi:MAG TPA: hypothetical protein VIX35_05740 [Vicinamibacterales bacterium]